MTNKIELSARFYLKNKILTSFPGPHSGEAQTYKSRPLSQPSQTTTPLSLTSVGELVVVQTMFSIRGSLTKTCAPKTFELPNCEIMDTYATDAYSWLTSLPQMDSLCIIHHRHRESSIGREHHLSYQIPN